MTLLLDALQPNLVQTVEGGPALVHGGPFGNIAHGCNSHHRDAARRSRSATSSMTEAGFGFDLGAEKFLDIKCRPAGCNPEAAVVVATVRALKMHGGVKKDELGTEDVAALERGLANLENHVENVRKFGVPVVVAINRFATDTDEEMQTVRTRAAAGTCAVALRDVWARAAKAARRLANEVMEPSSTRGGRVRAALRAAQPIKREDREHRAGDLRRARRGLQRRRRRRTRAVRGDRARATPRSASPRPSTRSQTTLPSWGGPPGSA